MSSEHVILKSSYEKLLFRHQELNKIIIDDIIIKHTSSDQIDSPETMKLLYGLFECLAQRLDVLFEIFISYNIPYSVNLNLLKGIGWHEFKKWFNDIGFTDDTFLAYYFYISSVNNKTLSKKISGETKQEQQDWAMETIQMCYDSNIPIKLSFPNFIEAVIRISISKENDIEQEIRSTVIGFIDKMMLKSYRSVVFKFKIYLKTIPIIQIMEDEEYNLIELYKEAIKDYSCTSKFIIKYFYRWRGLQPARKRQVYELQNNNTIIEEMEICRRAD